MAQARVMREAGVRRIVLANQLTDPSSIRWLAAQLDDPDFTPVCLVDSIDGVRLLDAHLAATGVEGTLQVLVELGHGGGRTGARSVSEAVRVATAVQASLHLRTRRGGDVRGDLGDGPLGGSASPRSQPCWTGVAVLDDEVGAIGRSPMMTPCSCPLAAARSSTWWSIDSGATGGENSPCEWPSAPGAI